MEEITCPVCDMNHHGPHRICEVCWDGEPSKGEPGGYSYWEKSQDDLIDQKGGNMEN